MRVKCLQIVFIFILLLSGCVNEGYNESKETLQPTPTLPPIPTAAPTLPPASIQGSIQALIIPEPVATITPTPTQTPSPEDKFSPMPTPDKIKMELDGEVKKAIVDLLTKFPTAVSDEKTYDAILSSLSHFGEYTIIPYGFKLFDLENDGIPEIVIDIGYWEGGRADIYKYIGGQYKKVGNSDYGYSFLNDDKGRLVLFECGEAYSDGTKYSYIDISGDKMVKDTVYSAGAWSVEDFNHIDNLTHDFWELLYNPSALDKSVKQIPEIDSTAIREEANILAMKYLADAKAGIKAVISVDGEIVDYNISIVELEGEFYTPAQGILDFVGVAFDYNELSHRLTFTKESHITDEFDLVKSQTIYDGHTEKLELPPKVIDGTLMLPLKFSSYIYLSAWIPEFNMVYITLRH